jgi:hypothetical protein
MNDLSKYMEVRGEMKTGDMLAWASPGIVGKLIRWRTGEYSHTSGIIRLSEYEGKPRRRFHLEAQEKGFYPAILSNEMATYGGHIWWYPLKDEYNPLRGAVGEKALSMVGVGYDFLSLFKNILGRVNTDAKKLFCSEAWFIIYRDALALPISRETKAPTPSDMPKLGIFKEGVQIL